MGDACDHYHRYEQDIALLKGLGFGAYRLSIEWARIEPEEGFFSQAALEHYRRVIAACRAASIVPIVTFHHFTAPLWFTRDGGWEDEKSVARFTRYRERAGRAFGDLIGYACTINEANVPILITAQREAMSGKAWQQPDSLKSFAEARGWDAERFAPYLVCKGVSAISYHDAVNIQFPRRPHDFIRGRSHALQPHYPFRSNSPLLQGSTRSPQDTLCLQALLGRRGKAANGPDSRSPRK